MLSLSYSPCTFALPPKWFRLPSDLVPTFGALKVGTKSVVLGNYDGDGTRSVNETCS